MQLRMPRTTSFPGPAFTGLPITGAALDRILVTIVLITGNLAVAERAVAAAIEAIEPAGISAETLLKTAVSIVFEANRHARQRLPQSGGVGSLLHPAMARVLSLPGETRACFVLRTLAGLSSGDCGDLTDLRPCEVEAHACAGARWLAEAPVGGEGLPCSMKGTHTAYESDTLSPQSGPKHLARQHHSRPSRHGYVEALY